jgi:hypothetical protein
MACLHVRTLMRKMGIEALYRKLRLTKTHPWVGWAVLARQQMSHPLGDKDSQNQPCPEACLTVFCSNSRPAAELLPHGNRRAPSTD